MPAKKVKKTQVYETTDFSLFKSEKEALDHQNELDLKECVEDWVDSWGWSGMSKSDVAEGAAENIDELINELIRIGIVKG
jgi:hypothetical protein